MADSSPLLALPCGLKPGARYVIKVRSAPSWANLQGGFLVAEREHDKDCLGSGATYAIVHLKDVGFWEFLPGEEPDTVKIRIVKGFFGQAKGWFLRPASKTRDKTSWWAEVSAEAEGAGAEWRLGPAGEPQVFKLRVAHGNCAGCSLGARKESASDARDWNSGYSMVHTAGEEEASEVTWSIEQLTLVSRAKYFKDEMISLAFFLDKEFELIVLVMVFFVGYYTDVFMEIYSAVQLFQTPSSFGLGLAMLVILFLSPLVCWFLLFANSLETPETVLWFALHVVPFWEVKTFVPKWLTWRKVLLEARKADTAPPLPPRKSPGLAWLPICKAAFGSSMTTLFKVYGTFLVTRQYLLAEGRTKEPTGLLGVFLSVLFSVASMGKSIVGLSNYGSSVSMGTMALQISRRSVQIGSRVGTVALLGIVFVEIHSIIMILTFDLVLQFMILLIHPASRTLMRNEMSASMLVFWALLMVLCAPPQFIPQLEDLHPLYYLVRTLELGLILSACGLRCGWLGGEVDWRSEAEEAVCKIADPRSADVPFWPRCLVGMTYLASAVVPFIFAASLYQKRQRKALQQRVNDFQAQQAMLASETAGCGLEPLAYGELLYLRAGSLPNRFLISDDCEGAAVQARSIQYTQAMKDTPDDLTRAGWRVVPGGGEQAEGAGERRYIRFGDIVKLRSELHEGVLLSGGRRGNAMFAVTAKFVEDLQDWPLDYDMEEHYKWRIVAVSSKDGPDPQLQIGEPVSLNARFALQALPKLRRSDELYLSLCRGATASEKQEEVWTVCFHSRPSSRDKPVEGSWPSFEVLAQRQLMVDSSDEVKLSEALYAELLRRERALLAAAEQQDVMMMTFMTQSGVPMWVTDYHFYTPLHHFILGYAREREQFLLEAKASGEEAAQLQVPHKMPLKLFSSMLHSGLPHLELGAAQMYTPLHFAALLGQRGLCELLLEAGADINAGDAEGWTCLHDAVLYDHRDTLLFLLGCDGLNVNAASLSGIRPLDIVTDEEVRSWLLACGAVPRAGEAEAEPRRPPPPPAGKELPTKFADPREDPELGKMTCEMDNQHLNSKCLAIRDPEEGALCMYCSRAGWNGYRSELCPIFKCPKCKGIHRIPYGDSLWCVCWACQTCGNYPKQARVEPGKLDYSGKRCRQLFESLDANGNGSLSEEEFNVFFEKFEGHGAASTGSQGTEGEGKTLQSTYAAEVFAKIDTDKSGDLSYEEFLAYFAEPEFPQGTKVKVESAFQSLDDPPVDLQPGAVGTILQIDEDGDAAIEFGPDVTSEQYLWVAHDDFFHLSVVQAAEPEEDENAGGAASGNDKKLLTKASRERLMRRRTTFSSVPCLEGCLLLV